MKSFNLQECSLKEENKIMRDIGENKQFSLQLSFGDILMLKNEIKSIPNIQSLF